MTIADTYGSLSIPVATTADTVVGDPLLGVLLDAFKTVLNARMGDAWASSGLAPGSDAVRGTYAHDPSKVEFSEKTLPALFLWRDGSVEAPYEHTSDRSISQDKLQLLWVFPTATQHKQSSRAPIFRAVVAVVDAFLRRNRDPAWIKAGDVSTQGLAYGTNLLRACGVWSLDVSRYSRVPVTIEMTDGEPRLTYEAIGIELTVLEELDQSGSADALGATGTTTIQSAELDGAGDPFVYAEIEAPV